MSSKRLSGNGGFDSQPYSFKHRRLSALRTFPDNCGLRAPISPKPNDARDMTFEPPSDEINKRGIEKSANSAKYVMAIPAVPLRSVQPVSLENDPKNSVPYGENDDGRKKGANEKENKEFSLDELWKQDSDKLAAIVAEAKSYLNAFDVKHYEKSPDLHRRSSIVEPNPEFVEQEKSAHGNLRESPFVKETSGLKNKSENYEDEVCILSPEEWRESRVREKVNFRRNREGISSCEPTDTKSEEEKEDQILTKLDECAPFEDNDPKYCGGNLEELINLNIVKPEEPKGLMVREALRLFEKNYNELMNERKIVPKVGRKNAYIHLEAANCLKIDGKYIFLEKPFGHVPGIEIGDEFQFRCQLAMIGLHRQLVSGIDHVILNGKRYANSVVDSGRYENISKTNDVLIYSGQGGNVKTNDISVHQKLERGNIALMNSKEMKYPIRVTYKRKSHACPERGVVYVYDGLYIINNAWHEKDQTGKLVFRFELHRLPGQPRAHQQAEAKMKVCMVDDISGGKEKMPIRAVNNVDDVRLLPKFSYITQMVYPDWLKKVEPVGCDCVNGCSDSHQCPCLVKNGGEIPYNENGSILRRKRRIHECGPSCKCPPTCMNRVSQHGPRYRLEIFKTELRGWGVRSRDLIPSGGFVCEYLGEFLQEKEADLRVGGDEYLFDIYNSRGGRADGFAIDAGVYGNVGRFINHSCSPNMYAQDVLYDHADNKMPRIMFFATEDISPLQELTYDYNYKLGMVCDASGNIKTKVCYCGSRECRRRMY
ncbi:Histone-lysine N-methyltransferase- H3 lysine-9 specific SUVH5 [Striga hermonthica]|uniref:Histone-lysine N-methyltransferase- H3 lysine-9 specific SUVH5 n=1 Tax=Striga hermonthica TaxID=68872 RepID=A0A9N7NPD3_STRHE|nr:Histone-lysine N-methyltransferase- H3 lysine-9 specific SUVH5 [Striga hermonthica]